MRQFAPALLLAAGACAPSRMPTALPGPATARLAALVDSAVAEGAVPGAVVAVSIAGRRWVHGAGELGIGPGFARVPDGAVRYDLASVTKIVALTTLAMVAVAEGRLDLDAPVAAAFPAYRAPGKDGVTLRHLLTHASGLPAWRPLYEAAPTRDSALALVLATPLDTLPGSRTVYSDLGAITAGLLVERALSAQLDELVAAHVVAPLGLTGTGYRPAPADLDRVAPTEVDPWRGRLLHGEVHDENAARLEGISAHAGLFATADDVLRFGEWWLDLVAGGHGDRSRTAAEFVRRQEVVRGSSRALGWDTPSNGSSAGSRLSNWSFGHTGYTGTSLWVDPSRALVVVLLTNRVHPTRQNGRHAPLRRAVADEAAAIADRLRGAR